MGFEVFEKGSAPMAKVPSLTIQKRGLISFNRSAWALIDNAPFVELLWDADSRMIGLRPADDRNPNAYPVRPQVSNSKTGPVLVAGSLFTQYIKLDTEEARRWAPQMVDGIMCVDLKDPGARVKSNRTRGAENKGAAREGAAPTTSSAHGDVNP